MTNLEELKSSPFIITIGRQYGSGGRAIGRLLATEFGIDYFDKELITLAATKSGLAAEYFERADEVAPRGLLSALTAPLSISGGATGSQCPLSRESIFQFQADVIHQLSNENSCIIVGRCADYILRENPRMISLFLTAPIEQRVARTALHESLTLRAAQEQCNGNDRRRRNYYDFYTDRLWGVASSYHLTIDTSRLGIDSTAGFLKNYIVERLSAAR